MQTDLRRAVLVLVLASRSPRRRELLDAAAIAHTVRPADIDESVIPGEQPIAYVQRMAREKAFAIARSDSEIVLAADTTVICEGQIMGKPADEAEAASMLRRLSGKWHEVITGICLLHRTAVVEDHASTRVWFSRISDETIEEYVRSGEPADKAGAYAIQGIASRYIERIDGSYSNVVGLPIELVWRALTQIRSSLS